MVKVKLSLYSPRRPLRLREVEAPIFSDIRLTDGGKVVSPAFQPLFTPRKIPKHDLSEVFSTDKSKHPYINNMFYIFRCGYWKLDCSSL
jgi:hypothetical protein